MNKDKLDKLFENMEGTFDTLETPLGHQRRFLEKLNSAHQESNKTNSWLRPLAIAASLAVILTVGVFMTNSNEEVSDLASVSPEMEQTQTFFTATINKELNTLNSFQSPETKALVDDALIQMASLEKEYDQLKIDLTESGNDKRVVYAMIANFQNRIDLLENVISTIENIKNFKSNTDEDKITI